MGKLTTRARNLASNLSYAKDDREAKIKFTLLELALLVDQRDIRAGRKYGKLVFFNQLGGSRYATFLETLLYFSFKLLPREL